MTVPFHWTDYFPFSISNGQRDGKVTREAKDPEQRESWGWKLEQKVSATATAASTGGVPYDSKLKAENRHDFGIHREGKKSASNLESHSSSWSGGGERMKVNWVQVQNGQPTEYATDWLTNKRVRVTLLIIIINVDHHHHHNQSFRFNCFTVAHRVIYCPSRDCAAIVAQHHLRVPVAKWVRANVTYVFNWKSETTSSRRRSHQARKMVLPRLRRIWRLLSNLQW